MADAVTSQTIQDGDRIAVMKFTNISDGSGEAAVKKVDVSALQAESGTGQAGPLTNNASSPTGDVMFTTTGHASGDRYTVMLAVRKSY